MNLFGKSEEPAADAPVANEQPAPDAPTTDQKQAIVRAVDAWFNERIYNSPVARSTEAWNHLHAYRDELVANILKELA